MSSFTPTAINQALIISGFHALSDPIRLRIIELLRQRELCVCDLCTALNVSQSKISFHLKTLKEATLVNHRQQGRWVYYSLNIPQFAYLERYLHQYSRLGSTLPARLC